MTEDARKAKANKKMWLFLLPLILFFAMTLLLFSGLGKDPTKLESQFIGKPVPAFEKLRLLDPTVSVTQNELQGPALLNVFASWCPSCYTEHPYLMKLAQSGEVKIYGLNYRDKYDAALNFVNKLGNPYELIVHDDKGRVGIELGVYGAPETFVIDGNNQIVYRYVGVVTEEVWQKILKPKMLQDQPLATAQTAVQGTRQTGEGE